MNYIPPKNGVMWKKPDIYQGLFFLWGAVYSTILGLLQNLRKLGPTIHGQAQ